MGSYLVLLPVFQKLISVLEVYCKATFDLRRHPTPNNHQVFTEMNQKRPCRRMVSGKVWNEKIRYFLQHSQTWQDFTYFFQVFYKSRILQIFCNNFYYLLYSYFSRYFLLFSMLYSLRDGGWINLKHSGEIKVVKLCFV